MKDKDGRNLTWEVRRGDLKGDWKKPTVVQAEFEGIPKDFRFYHVSSTADNLHLYCIADIPPNGSRVGILSRTKPSGPFTSWTEIPLKNPSGQYPKCFKPQFVSETSELFLVSGQFFADQAVAEKKKTDLWVIKDFRPFYQTSEK